MTVTIPALSGLGLGAEFKPWPKTPRLYTDENTITVTEKIDGTNACVVITEDGQIHCQSRKRFITPANDNHGFAAWVEEHADKLKEVLGPGYHFGEFWGYGINRGYDCDPGDKRFYLFNTAKWGHFSDPETMPDIPGLGVVPVLYRGIFAEWKILDAKFELLDYGSIAKPGYMNPEGLCVFHSPSNQIFKWPFNK